VSLSFAELLVMFLMIEPLTLNNFKIGKIATSICPENTFLYLETDKEDPQEKWI